VNNRKIIHIDMDAFYASVEQLDHPDYRGKPLVVGGSAERGVVAAASYQARKYGIRSAMPMKTAMRKCPQLIVVYPRFDRYKELSSKIRAIFYEYTDLVEPLSLDEAFLDVTQNKKGLPSASLIAKEIKQRIKDELQLVASAGVSYNKFLAKIASDYDKPDGFYLITPKQGEDFVARLPIEKFFGVGKATAEKMKRLGIHNGADVKKKSLPELLAYFGKSGAYFYHIARGVDNRAVEAHHVRKSIGAEETFMSDIDALEDVCYELELLAAEVWQRVDKYRLYGKTLTLKIKYADFKQITRSKTLLQTISDKETIKQLSNMLFDEVDTQGKKIRLLGITISNFDYLRPGEGLQLTLDL